MIFYASVATFAFDWPHRGFPPVRLVVFVSNLETDLVVRRLF